MEVLHVSRGELREGGREEWWVGGREGGREVREEEREGEREEGREREGRGWRE